MPRLAEAVSKSWQSNFAQVRGQVVGARYTPWVLTGRQQFRHIHSFQSLAVALREVQVGGCRRSVAAVPRRSECASARNPRQHRRPRACCCLWNLGEDQPPQQSEHLGILAAAVMTEWSAAQAARNGRMGLPLWGWMQVGGNCQCTAEGTVFAAGRGMFCQVHSLILECRPTVVSQIDMGRACIAPCSRPVLLIQQQRHRCN